MSNPVASIGRLALSLILSKTSANATYQRLMPSLKFIILQKGRNSEEAKGLFEILENLPSAGARRENFKKFYIEKLDGWKELPNDPDKIPFGFWH